MKQIIWQDINEEEKNALLMRPAIAQGEKVSETVAEIIAEVRLRGDEALIELTGKLDQFHSETFKVSFKEIKAASDQINNPLKLAIDKASENIKAFHQAQELKPVRVETQPGIVCEQITRPINSVGLYIPAGSAPLISTVLMLGIPARIAGCQRVVLCSPPPIANEILYAASLCGITEIYSLGGAQAIAAMAYGTETIARVDKLFGPGSAYVTEAKRQVCADYQGAMIDMPAGPSEVLVIADSDADPDFIAADLLSQAEHGPDSQVVLVTPDKQIAEKTAESVRYQLAKLPRAEIAGQALESSLLIVAETLDECVSIANQYGPEHLVIQTRNPRELLPWLDQAGSIFLGQWSPESMGDYASGTNHVLPTYGYTRSCSSLGLADFTRRMTVQELTAEGFLNLAPTVTALADAEGLAAHGQAVTLRMEKLKAAGFER